MIYAMFSIKSYVITTNCEKIKLKTAKTSQVKQLFILLYTISGAHV